MYPPREATLVNNFLRVVEHLSYVVECLALTYSGEARSELIQLIQAMRSDPRYEIADSALVIEKLEEGLANLNRRSADDSDYLRGIGDVVRVQRGLWKRAMDAEGKVLDLTEFASR